jgi:hypothetical protein
MYCKHCECTFTNKYTLERHLQTSKNQDDTNNIPAKHVLIQLNRWVELDKSIPDHCEQCFTIFKNRQQKHRHPTSKCCLPINKSSKDEIDRCSIERDKAHSLLIGRIRDRTFSRGFTYADIKKRLGTMCFIETLINQDLTCVIQEVYIKNTSIPLFNILQYNPEKDAFKAYEYTDWFDIDRKNVITSLLDKATFLINGFVYIGKNDYDEILKDHPFKTSLYLWVENLNDDEEIQKEQYCNIDKLFISQK